MTSNGTTTSSSTSTSTSTNSNTVTDRKEFYTTLLKQAIKRVKTSNDAIANLANISSLIYQNLRNEYGTNSVNWVGFYISRPKKQKHSRDQYDRVLVLGPFHGQPAVTEIPYSRGVCGACARTEQVELVSDVHSREDHIACDPNSQSEIVIPVFDSRGRFVAELDIDSPVVNGMTEQDEFGLKPIIELLKDNNWSIADIPHDAKVRDDDIPACTH